MNTSLSFLSKGRVNNFNLIRMLAAIGVLISHSFPLTLGRGAGDLISNSFGVSIGTICLYVFFACRISLRYLFMAYSRKACIMLENIG